MKQKMKNEGELKVSPKTFIAEVIDAKFVQTEAYIGAQCKGNYKTNQNKSYYKG